MKMKLKFLGVLLLVCLMTTGVFAGNFTWTSTIGGSWATSANWNATPVPPGVYNDTYLLYGRATMGGGATVDSVVSPYNGRARISWDKPAVGDTNAARLNIVSGGSISIAELRVGEQGISSTAGSYGEIVQTGGTVNMIASSSGTGSYSRNIILGRGGSSGPAAEGLYKISGGTITYDNTLAYNTARLLVGASPNATGSTGTFRVIGNAASITMKSLYVGSDGTAGRGGTGTMEFQIGDSGVDKVSRVVLDDAVILDNQGAASIANLVVSLLATAPLEDIVLIETKSPNAVSGIFDSLNGVVGGADEGDTVVLGGITFTLTYRYDVATATRDIGNDIALLIPEPATVALLSLGLLAIRRKK
jgi:hypothetical protein